MGLDITHNKIRKSLPDPVNHLNQGCFYEDDFKLFKSIAQIEHQVHEIIYCNIIKTFELVEEEKDFDDLTKRNKFNLEYNYPIRNFRLVTNEKEKTESLREFEQANNLNGLFKYSKKGKWQAIQYYEIETKLGFYYEEIGYQRKGINDNLWKYFNPELDIYCFTDKSDFLNVYKCIDKYWDSDTKEIIQKRKEDFKRKFIDQYELGKSYLAISY